VVYLGRGNAWLPVLLMWSTRPPLGDYCSRDWLVLSLCAVLSVDVGVAISADYLADAHISGEEKLVDKAGSLSGSFLGHGV